MASFDTPEIGQLDGDSLIEGPGDRVKIMDGPFENLEGTVEEIIEARGLVKVGLFFLSRTASIDFEYWQVVRI